MSAAEGPSAFHQVTGYEFLPLGVRKDEANGAASAWNAFVFVDEPQLHSVNYHVNDEARHNF